MARLLLIISFALFTSACSTSPTNNFYILTANSSANSVTKNAENNSTSNTKVDDENSVNKSVVGVGPITVPDYLQRSPIAYSMTNNHLIVSSVDQWSEPLDKAIGRVMAVNLSRLYPSRSTLTFPWRIESKPQFAIRISIIELNRQSVDQAVLEADWTLVDIKKRQVLHRARFSQMIRTSEFSYANLAYAYSDLLAMLSHTIDKVLQSY